MKASYLADSITRAEAHIVREMSGDTWSRILDNFLDASIFQTIPFGRIRSAREQLEHLLVERRGEVVAAAQVRLLSVPLSRTRIAYVFWGPLFQRRTADRDWDALTEALTALREEYVMRRGISLRIAPGFLLEEEPRLSPAFANTGYSSASVLRNNRTIIVDLRRSINELRQGLDKKWRNCLSSAERNGLEVREGSDESMFDLFLCVYREMLRRKQIAESGDFRSFRAMQPMLPQRHKMQVVVALENGRPCAGAIYSAIGRTGVYLFGGTADSGTRNKASYLVQWRVTQRLKEAGCTEYDLNGSNAETNPGVYGFKVGLCGRNGKEVESAGVFEAYSSTQQRVMLRVADSGNQKLKKLKSWYGKYRSFRG